MTNTTVVFVQAGFPHFLKYAVEQAMSCGYRVVVLGDSSVGDEIRCEFYNFDDYFSRARDFASRYKHIGSNSPDYELFCFQRWYIVRDVMDSIGGDIIVLDSDVLAYEGIDYIKSLCKEKRMFNVPWVNYFSSTEDLDFYLDFVDEVYLDQDRLERLSHKYVYAGVPQMSDMYLFYEIGEVYPREVLNIRDFGPYLGIDSCFRDIVAFKNEHHHKTVSFEGNIPFCELEVGGRTRFFTFHFQGISKPLMQYMHTIGDQEALNRLEDLGFWFTLPGHDGIASYELTLAAYQALKTREHRVGSFLSNLSRKTMHSALSLLSGHRERRSAPD